ncbi:multidrug effflux MFS transporter [Roseibium sp. MMSF_3412]|uniref:multidrug effflux MFS transporter n=1 Tax=Roseibium sp. MMSF_3412 TaxID=3046712 RepID=UPI00274000EA|nr:multidrug effflux MFS transporter [Roseibium sp. MMSF_3412]
MDYGHPEQNRIAKAPSLGVLIAISTVSPLAMQIYLPSLAGMMIVFSASAGEIQLSMSAYFIALAISQLFWGPLSDQFGRRPVIIAGMALFVSATVWCLFAPSIEWLIAARVVQAAGGSAGIVLARAIVRDLYGPAQAASRIGYVTMGMAVMPTIAPALGGVLDQYYGWQGGFVLLLLIGVGVFVTSYLSLPETNLMRSSAGFGRAFRAYRILMGEPLFWSYALTASFSALTYFAYLGGAPFIAAQLLSLSAAEMGLYFMLVAVGYIVGNFLSGKFSERVGLYPMIISGTLLSLLCVALMGGLAYAGVVTATSIFLPMFVLGLGNGICLPSTISGAVSVRPEHAGSASGLVASMQVGWGAAAGTLVAWLFAGSFLAGSVWSMILIMMFGAAANLVAALTIKRASAAQRLVPAE